MDHISGTGSAVSISMVLSFSWS